MRHYDKMFDDTNKHSWIYPQQKHACEEYVVHQSIINGPNRILLLYNIISIA